MQEKKERHSPSSGLTSFQAIGKRSFDLLFATAGFGLTVWIMLPAVLLAAVDTRSGGLFTQKRVGRGGKIFNIMKIRTMRHNPAIETSVTTENDSRITPLGKFLRRAKIDELPQLINIIRGDMSFVGPRPDVPGFADRLDGKDRIILSVRPGITGPATLKYRHEESLLAGVDEPERYNREVIFPDKVRINRSYVENWSFSGDMRYLLRTVFPFLLP